MHSNDKVGRKNVRDSVQYSHEEEASTDMVGNWTHPDVAVFLQIFRCDHCWQSTGGEFSLVGIEKKKFYLMQ